MPRIRTIKPEFPQSESMGRVSRDARLLFVQMWTLADDSGRLRGNSRMLASLLFPYDDDAPSLISGWLDELETQNCIVRYVGDDGCSYVAICKWSEHQRIDKPTESKLPAPDSGRIREDSRSTREDSPLDQGPRTKEGTKDQGPRKEKKQKQAEPIFEILNDDAFASVWDRWQRHRCEKCKPLGQIEAETQLMELTRYGPAEAAHMVEFSIRAGAVNLITNGDHRNRGSPGDRRKSAAASGGMSREVAF